MDDERISKEDFLYNEERELISLLNYFIKETNEWIKKTGSTDDVIDEVLKKYESEKQMVLNAQARRKEEYENELIEFEKNKYEYNTPCPICNNKEPKFILGEDINEITKLRSNVVRCNGCNARLINCKPNNSDDEIKLDKRYINSIMEVQEDGFCYYEHLGEMKAVFDKIYYKLNDIIEKEKEIKIQLKCIRKASDEYLEAIGKLVLHYRELMLIHKNQDKKLGEA